MQKFAFVAPERAACARVSGKVVFFICVYVCGGVWCGTRYKFAGRLQLLTTYTNKQESPNGGPWRQRTNCGVHVMPEIPIKLSGGA